MKTKIPIYTIENFKSYKNDGILVSRFAHYLQLHQHLHLHATHRHTFYHLVFFTDGTGKQAIDFKEFPIEPGIIYFMVPGQVHHWDFTPNALEPDGYIINFSANYLAAFLLDQDYLEKFSFFSGQPNDQVIKLSATLQEKVSDILEAMLKEGQNEHPMSDDLVKTLLISLFIEIARVNNSAAALEGNAYNHTLLKNFQKLISENYTKLKLPKQYAALLYITPNHLNALCNDFLGISAGKLIRDRVILEAKRLLINRELMVAEIAEQLNFSDQSYFIKFFKKYEGITPEKFRKLNIN